MLRIGFVTLFRAKPVHFLPEIESFCSDFQEKNGKKKRLYQKNVVHQKPGKFVVNRSSERIMGIQKKIHSRSKQRYNGHKLNENKTTKKRLSCH